MRVFQCSPMWKPLKSVGSWGEGGNAIVHQIAHWYFSGYQADRDQRDVLPWPSGQGQSVLVNPNPWEFQCWGNTFFLPVVPLLQRALPLPEKHFSLCFLGGCNFFQPCLIFSDCPPFVFSSVMPDWHMTLLLPCPPGGISGFLSG